MRLNELNTPVQPDTYEASMFIKQAIRAGKYAIQIHNLFDNDQEVEAWVQKKIDLATNYISTVGHYLEGQEMTEEKTPQEKLRIMSKIEKIKRQSKNLAGDKDEDLIDKNKKLLA